MAGMADVIEFPDYPSPERWAAILAAVAECERERERELNHPSTPTTPRLRVVR